MSLKILLRNKSAAIGLYMSEYNTFSPIDRCAFVIQTENAPEHYSPKNCHHLA